VHVLNLNCGSASGSLFVCLFGCAERKRSINLTTLTCMMMCLNVGESLDKTRSINLMARVAAPVDFNCRIIIILLQKLSHKV
jgi:hypothetical protein